MPLRSLPSSYTRASRLDSLRESARPTCDRSRCFKLTRVTPLPSVRFLITLSHTRIGDKYLAIDILITALAGGFTVLSTKAFSSFLTKSFLDW